ncbi:MAG: HAMP domain-containing histidine kinase, partial [Bacilli bacterium]|nr:HAMP domain-containing histidine kinase [Bacilli bacterium]
MKRNNLTIKSLLYFISFSVVILLILWLTQVELLGVFYEKYQIKNVESVASSIDKNIVDIEQRLENYAYNNGMCIQYYKTDEIKEYNTKNPGCLLSAKNSTIAKVKKVLYYSNQERFIKLYAPGTGTKSIIYLVRLDDNNFIYLNTTLEDINTTSKILKRNLIYIIFVIMLLCFLVSVILAKKINKPILNLISSAKELGKGNYNVEFKKSNIAELDELADVLEVAASEMNKTEELRRDLIANVSHDLKTPLTMIKAYAEKVRDLSYKDKEKREKDLNIIIEEADRLNYLVNDLLDMSKIEAGANSLTLEEYDLIEDIKTIIKRYEIVKETENYKFELDLPEKAIIKADRSKINQVIYNLVNNAIEHTGDDLVVKITVNKNKDHYMVKITDTGKGIAEEDKILV